MKKRHGRLELHRETLHRLEPETLGRVVGGAAPTLEVTCLCTQGDTLCGGITCGPCAYTVVGCDGGDTGP
jgi:hypothetical protein